MGFEAVVLLPRFVGTVGSAWVGEMKGAMKGKMSWRLSYDDEVSIGGDTW